MQVSVCESERRHERDVRYVIVTRNPLTGTDYAVQSYWRDAGDQVGRLYLAGDYDRAVADCETRREAGDVHCHVVQVSGGGAA
jgi:hypothetical protein